MQSVDGVRAGASNSPVANALRNLGPWDSSCSFSWGREEHPALLCNQRSLTQVRGQCIPQMSHSWPDPGHRSLNHFCIRGLHPAIAPSPEAGDRLSLRSDGSWPRCV